ncbi:MAG: hypothetical protein AABZ47_03465, partial [Planctomycetota bacterium]
RFFVALSALMTKIGQFEYITDNFSGTVDYDPGPEVHTLTSKTGTSCLVKLTPDGEYIWARAPADYYIPTRNLTVDSNGDVIAVGEGIDIVVAKYYANGEPAWRYKMGSVASQNDEAQHVAVDADNNVYIGGYFHGFINLNPIFLGWPDWHDAVPCGFPQFKTFVTKFSPDGDYLWSRSFECDVTLVAMDVYPDGSVIVAGGTNGPADLDPTEGVNLCQQPGMFITKLGADGSYLWSYFVAGRVDPNHLNLLPNGDILLSGDTFAYTQVDFDPTDGVLPYHCDCECSCTFLLCLDSEAQPRWLRQFQNIQMPHPAMAVSHSGEIYTVNYYNSTPDADPTCGEDILQIGPTHNESFLTKLSCITNPGDIDNDGDVDLLDLAQFQNCFRGAGSRSCSPGCDAFDLSPDNSLDLADYTVMSTSVTGPK